MHLRRFVSGAAAFTIVWAGQAFGFAPAGVRKGYYVETNEDAIVMWVHDINTPEYADRVARLRAGVPGGTVLEELDP
jgi:hypothetical protein